MHSLAVPFASKPGVFRPISSYVLKIASRCNLNCSYCHMYNLVDKSYLELPAVMSDAVVDATISRIKDHALRHRLESVILIFHGGEPLLAGETFFRKFVKAANERLKPAVTPRFSMQTNATLLSSQWLEVLAELGIGFGISLDGTPEANDANRVDHHGRGSYAQIAKAIELITTNRRFRDISKLMLSVINLEADPIETFKHLKGLGLKGVDFHLPDGTYDNPPPGKTKDSDDTPYADWLIPVFDAWFDKADRDFRIRFFENIIGLILGADFSSDNIGGRKSNVVVIETDGGIEPIPSLKACGQGFTKVGLNVLDNAIDDVYGIPLFRTYLGGSDALCDTCKRCPIVDVCGGGYLPHRYSSVNGFDNPSIYCKDLMKLIKHIQQKTLSAIPDNVCAKLRSAT